MNFGNGDVKQKLLDKHTEAERMFNDWPNKRTAAVIRYTAYLRAGPLSFQTIQCDAALLARDCLWLTEGPPPNEDTCIHCDGFRRATVFYCENASLTPRDRLSSPWI